MTKRYTKNSYVIIFSLIALFCSSAATEAADICWSACEYEQYLTKSFWDRHGQKRPAFNHFTARSIHIFAGCNLPCNNILETSATWTAIDESLNGRRRGIEDVECYWTHRLLQRGSSALSGCLTAIIPCGDYVPTLRYGRWGGQYSLIYSWACDSFPVSMEIEGGYRYYQGFPSDQIRGRIALDYVPIEKITLSLYGETEYGVFNGKRKIHESFIRYNPNYRLVKAGGECSYNVFRGWDIALGGYAHLWGENVGRGGGAIGRIGCCF